MRKNILLILIVLFTFLFFKGALSYYFISDDFYYTSFKSIVQAIFPKQGLYHYNPLFWSILYLVKSVFGLNPYPFHLVTILIHILNIILVYFLAKLISKSTMKGLVAALLFSVFFSNYEIVYWITGLNTSLMVLFYVLSLMTFIRLIDQITILRYSLFMLFFILAILSHEYALSLPAICFFYWLIFASDKNKLSNGFKIFILPTLIILFLLLLKLQFTHSSLIVSSPTIGRFVASIIKSTLYLFIPNPYFIDRIPKIFLPLLFLILVVFLFIKSFRNKTNFFLLFWTFTTILIFSATSLPQARYFYLSSIPSILLIISIFKLAKFNWKIIYLFFIVISGIIFLGQQEKYWRETSIITRQALADIKKLYPDPDKNKTIYFINLPDSINGPPWNAYLFRNGLDNALSSTYGKDIINIKYLRTKPLDEKIRNDSYINFDFIKKLKTEGGIIFIYYSDKKTVKLL